MSSIRRTLTVRLLCILGLMMGVVTVALYLGVRAALVAQFDATLRARLATLESATRWDGRSVDLDFVSDAMPWYRPGPDAEYFEVRLERSAGTPGGVVAASPSLGSAGLDMRTDGTSAIMDARLPDGRRGRMASQLFEPPPEEDLDAPGQELERSRVVATTPTVRVTVAMSRARLDAALRTIGMALVAAGGVMVVGLVSGVRLALRSGLAPLRTLSAEVERVRADTLSARLPGRDLPDELRPMHTRLNELIERLEVAFSREQRFARAAAHELRTPIAELRSLLEVSLSRARSPQSARETMEEALGITVRMESLVRSLLALARPASISEAGILPTVPLQPVLLRVVGRFEAAAAARGGSLVCTGSTSAAVSADPGALESILTNVLANAVEYARPVPMLRCDIQPDGHDRVRIDVTNPIQGVTAEDVSHFFDPLWRRSESRTEQSHLGLGLALARALAVGLGGDLSAELDDSQTVRIRVQLRGAVEDVVVSLRTTPVAAAADGGATRQRTGPG